MAGVARAALLTLGTLCIVHAAVTLALRGASWNLSAYSCLLLAVLLLVFRLVREGGCGARTLYWDRAATGFRMDALPGIMELTHVWRGPAWVTLRLQPRAEPGPFVHVVVWKSAVPAPLWSELALYTQASAFRGNGHQNKEAP